MQTSSTVYTSSILEKLKLHAKIYGALLQMQLLSSLCHTMDLCYLTVKLTKSVEKESSHKYILLVPTNSSPPCSKLLLLSRTRVLWRWIFRHSYWKCGPCYTSKAQSRSFQRETRPKRFDQSQAELFIVSWLMPQETVALVPHVFAPSSVCVQYNYRNRGSLTFEPLTLVPIQVKMMNTELLTQKEVRMFDGLKHFPSWNYKFISKGFYWWRDKRKPSSVANVTRTGVEIQERLQSRMALNKWNDALKWKTSSSFYTFMYI